MAARTITALTAVMLITVAALAETETIESFKLRAERSRAAIIKLEAEHAAAKTAYELSAVKIGEQKAIKRPDGPISGFVYDMKLKLMLNAGSKAAYRYDAVEKQLADARDEYFTYALVIIDGMNQGMRQCIREKCGSMDRLFSEREKWIKVIDYDSLLEFDYSPRSDEIKSRAGADKEIKEDLAQYYEKRLVQADQRINLLSEELQLLADVKKTGIKIDEARVKKLKDRLIRMKASRREISAHITTM